jgi:hypothetical protein
MNATMRKATDSAAIADAAGDSFPLHARLAPGQQCNSGIDSLPPVSCAWPAAFPKAISLPPVSCAWPAAFPKA